MSFDNHGASDHERRACPPPAHPQNTTVQHYPLLFPPESLAMPSNHDAHSDHSILDERPGTDDRSLKHGQSPSTNLRPSQNRAAFGRWKSKTIPGFPAADVPLPQGITPIEVAELYPNHVDDYCILALMRQGRGAKAIDALIPAPAGKTKAGQSHSKIQLRISTIREAFPDEHFPITSTKRGRTRSRGEAPKDETIDSEDEHGIVVTANHMSDSHRTTAEALATVNLHTADTHHQNSRRVFRDGGHGHPTRSGTFGSLPQQEGLLLLSEPKDDVLPFTPELVDPALRFQQPLTLEDQIREEYEIHQQLVHDHFYCDRPLPPLEMRQTVQAHCAWIYDRISYTLQTKSGLKMEKCMLPSGWSEHSISYLHRTITECFRGHPVFRAQIDVEPPQTQATKRFETAILQDLLGRLRDWTRYLKVQKESAGQTRAHQKLHWTVSTNRSSAPNQPDLQSTPPQIHASAGLAPARLKVSGPEDHTTMAALAVTPEAARNEFEQYMKDTERFINHEAMAVELPSVSGKLKPIF